MADALIPADRERCQAERREGSFMTLGPRSMVRCSARPIWLAREVKPGADGLCGEMSLCQPCAEVMTKHFPDMAKRVRLVPINRPD